MSLQVLRGVDVCTDELGIPNWVLAPLLEIVHRAGAEASAAARPAVALRCRHSERRSTWARTLSTCCRDYGGLTSAGTVLDARGGSHWPRLGSGR